MQPPPSTPAAPRNSVGTPVHLSRAELLERLLKHEVLRDLPDSELDWLIRNGELRRVEVGDLITSPRLGPVEEMAIVLEGHVAIYVDRGRGPGRVVDWGPGGITGMLPYSRMKLPPGEGVVEEAGEIFMVHRAHFPEMVRECQELTTRVVQLMLDRARHFTHFDLHNEKMASLGRLAAGLAHELDNPAAAVIRSAKLLVELQSEADAAARLLGSSGITEDEMRTLEEILGRCSSAPVQQVRSTLEQARHEEAMMDWLEDHDIDLANEDVLADAPVLVEMLEEAAAAVDPSILQPAIAWVISGCAVRGVAAELGNAAERISDLVKAVKGFTQMDISAAPERIDVLEGLTQALTVLRAKARQKSASIKMNASPDLPRVCAIAGELNQVWSNLIDNALDAVEHGGSIEISAKQEGDSVAVHVVDDGQGIPEAIADQVFDPFFTTKPVGEGTGLGLDIVRRLVERQGGTVSFSSVPGRTDFRVELPLESGSRGGVTG